MLKFVLPASLLVSLSAVAQTNVVTSVKPVSMVVSAIGGDYVNIEQLVTNQASPHDFALRPSDLRKLDQAELVVWVGESLETFMEKPLANLSNKKDIEWMALNNMYLRQFGESEAHDHDHHEGHDEHDHEGHDEHEDHDHHEGHDEHDHDEHEDHDHHEDHDDNDHEDHDAHGHEGHHHTGTDPHVWLDPENAKVLARAVATQLGKIDPEHQQAFEANYHAFIDNVAAADKKVAHTLEPVADVPYFVFHEAYGYFEGHYGLNNKGAVSISPERKPGAKTVAHIREQIEEHNVACVFSEPQFSPAIVDTLIDGTDVKTATLDPLGVSLKLSSDSYPAFLEALAGQYASCLK